MLDDDLTLAFRAVHAASEAALRPLRLTPDEYRVLEVLAGPERRAMGAIAGLTGLLLPHLSKIAARLESRGLIRRATDADDTRRSHLSLTPQGDRHRQAAREAMQGARRRFTERLGPWDEDRLTKLLQKLVPGAGESGRG